MRRMRDEADMEGKSHYTACSRGSLGPDLFLTGLAQQLRQLGDIGPGPYWAPQQYTSNGAAERREATVRCANRRLPVVSKL